MNFQQTKNVGRRNTAWDGDAVRSCSEFFSLKSSRPDALRERDDLIPLASQVVVVQALKEEFVFGLFLGQ